MAQQQWTLCGHPVGVKPTSIQDPKMDPNFKVMGVVVDRVQGPTEAEVQLANERFEPPDPTQTEAFVNSRMRDPSYRLHLWRSAFCDGAEDGVVTTAAWTPQDMRDWARWAHDNPKKWMHRCDPRRGITPDEAEQDAYAIERSRAFRKLAESIN